MIRLKVKEIAAKRKVGIGRLSRLADIDIKTLRRIYREPESANTRLETLNKLAYALRVDARDLLDYERDAQPPGLQDDDDELPEMPEKP